MAKKPGKSKKGTALRAQAEKLLLATKQEVAAMPLKNVQQLVHELQVHQIELEMQNDELRRTEVELEAARDRYVDLYDFSPTAHLTMDRRGKIVEANLRAGTLLGINRQELIGQPFARFFASEDQDIFHLHCQDVLKTGTRQTCDLHLRSKSGAISWVHLESLAVPDESGPLTHWRTALLDISERKRTEEMQARLAAIVEGSNDAIFGNDLDGIITSWNQAAQRLFGYTEQEVIGRPVSMLFSPYRKDEELYILDKIKRGESVRHYETALRRKDGSLSDVSMTVSPIKDSQGRIIGASKIARDLTEPKRVEVALRTSKEQFQAVFIQTTGGIAQTDVAGRFVLVNDRYCDIVGRSREELLTLRMQDITHPDDLSANMEQFHALVQGGPRFIVEKRYLHPDGSIMWVHNDVSAVRDSGGWVTHVIAVVTDITERKRTEEALRKSEERYRSMFENAVEGIFQTTLGGKYVAVNPALARMNGYDSPEDMIATITDVASQLYVDPGRRDEFIRLMQEQETVSGFEALVSRKDGSFIWISENARTLRDQAGTLVGYEGTVKNITEQKLGEEQLRTTIEEVRLLSGRLATAQEEERTRIARELHDELGVGLTCLKIDLSRLVAIVGGDIGGAARAKLDDRVCSMVEQVDGTIASVQRLVTQLRPALLDDLGLVAAIEWQCRDFQKRTGIPCACVTSADDIAMEPERARALFRICQEALTNTARHAQATAVTVKLESRNDFLQLVVADNGVGIPDTKVSDHQSLGLLGMRERAALFGGEITIQGHPEKGTTVTTCLPRCPA